MGARARRGCGSRGREGRPTKIISYNLREHTASGELAAIAERYDADVLCLQECDSTDMPLHIGPLALVDQTRGNRLGLAMYLRSDRFQVHRTKVFALRKSLHDRVMAPAHERLLAAHLTDLQTGCEVLVGDFHAAPLTASNSLRRKQIAAAHEGMRTMKAGVPAVMVGDFNYPWFVRGLERKLSTTGYQLTRTNAPTYVRYRYFSGYFDFVTSTGFHIDDIDVLPQGASDHLPISLTARIAA
ncbi:endonuclease/exonuclease/phosphatase family protein [Amnibacterium sp.]|uniref:endonuclease/exonuclease/phosphatase family protein n=1 Tax=Amnibacterium sp. TaxID=1872496 RepID=UPI0026372185|nr:endonuclease/exonuclease/phosphatase family protein [Amnibacterium sp.]